MNKIKLIKKYYNNLLIICLNDRKIKVLLLNKLFINFIYC